jgi:Icc-related predicted phosphoesterase
VRILAVSDIHSPKYLEEFSRSLSGLEKPDVFLLAGDIIHFGKTSEYRNVIDAIDAHLGTGFPIIACFGNEEHEETREELVDMMNKRVIILDEEATGINVGTQRIGIIGTAAPHNRYYSRGVQDERISNIFKKRVTRMSQLLEATERDADLIILLSHYSPLVESNNQDDMDSFSWWISQAINDVQPNLVIHGHIHFSERLEVTVGKTRVINVAFPASKKITEISL